MLTIGARALHALPAHVCTSVPRVVCSQRRLCPADSVSVDLRRCPAVKDEYDPCSSAFASGAPVESAFREPHYGFAGKKGKRCGLSYSGHAWVSGKPQSRDASVFPESLKSRNSGSEAQPVPFARRPRTLMGCPRNSNILRICRYLPATTGLVRREECLV